MSVTIIIKRHTRRYGICTLQYDRFGVSRPTQNGNANTRTKGNPDTVRLPVETGKPNLITLEQDMQLWMHELCWSRTPSMKKEDAQLSWKSLMSGASEGNTRSARAFSNFTGSGTNRDYVNDANRNAEPIKIDFVLCGGAFVEILGEDNRQAIKSQDCLVVKAIDPAKDFREYHFKTHATLFFYPTNSVRIPYLDKKGQPTGKYIEYVSQPFPQYNDKSVMPIFGQKGEGFIYVPKDRITLADKPGSPFRNTVEKDAYHNYTTYNYPDPYPGTEF